MDDLLLNAALICAAVLAVWGVLEVCGFRVMVFEDRRRPLALFVLGAALLGGWFSLRQSDEAAAHRPSPPPRIATADAETEAAAKKRPAISRPLQHRGTVASEGYIFLGQRLGSQAALGRFASAGALSADRVPPPGYAVKTRTPVYLRVALPDAHKPLVMKPVLGMIPAGTRLRIDTVTRIDPGGYYWAGVQVLPPSRGG